VFKKILIANRGEIAVRIARACTEMGITSVAIYSEADRYGLHVKKSDKAYCIGAEPIAGYLNAEEIVNLAATQGCDAIHPGYGFLSENPELAIACGRCGVIFIGPSPVAIIQMGDKIQARRLMQAAGLPVVPGSDGILTDVEEAVSLAERIGYPVMLKAVAGGGGRGIRRVQDAPELRHQYPRVVSEATKAFGQGGIFLEKCIVNPKHIEVQILADKKGTVLHLFDRDCSIQRRHQKLIEIAPSPQITEQQRELITQYAVQAAKAAHYENAGTVEFLVDNDGQIYFMEMNTRLQVEHTITEQITGIDIVQQQIRIAAGEPLNFTQKDIIKRGYAMEFRINAEDPRNDFLPSFGRITRYYPPGGPGVRLDAAIYTGYEIPPYYDSMCAKLTIWALNWQDLLARGERVLKEMRIYGVKTTIPYYLQIIKNNDFRQATFNTSFVESHPELVNYSTRTQQHHIATAIAAAVSAYLGR